MSFVISIEILGEQQVLRGLQRFTHAAEDMRPAFTILAADFLDIERKQFQSQGGYRSGGWQALSPDWLRTKIRRGQDPRILHATLAMRNSLTRRGARGSIRTIRRDELRLGTRVTSRRGFPYPQAHQSGTRNMPQRRPVELYETDRRRWVKVLQAEIVKAYRMGTVRA